MAVSAEVIQFHNNPFDDQVDSLNYFEDEQRADIRQKINYYLEFGTDILFIHGALESGKTTLIKRIIEDKKDDWMSCYATAQQGGEVGSLVNILANCFSINHSQPEAILGDLAEKLTEIHSKGKMATLFLDDAHLFSAPIFKLIASIAGIKISGQPVLRIVLVGRDIPEALVNQIESSTSELTRVEVPAFTEEQTSTYITHRLAAAGSSKQSLFDSSVIDRIFKQSKGQPSHINALAYAKLSQPAETGSAKNPASGSQSNHFGLKLIAFALAISVVISLFLFRSEQSAQSDLEQTQLAIPEVQKPEENVVPPKMIPEPPPTETQQQASVEEKPLPVNGTQKSEQEHAVEKIEPTKAVVETTTQIVPQAEKPHDPNSWIKQQPAGNFTLQLVALASEASANSFISKNKLGSESAYFKTVKKGKTYYAVITGSYSSRQSAQTAARQLPKDIGTPKPWIRSFAGIQKSLKQ